MPKYIAIDLTHQTRSPITGQYQNTPTSIVAIFDCRSHKRATAIASAALEIPKLSVQLYSSLSAAKRVWADNAKVLEVPEGDRPTGTPVGKVKIKEMLSLKVWVDPEIVEVFKSIDNKSAWVADAIKLKMFGADRVELPSDLIECLSCGFGGTRSDLIFDHPSNSSDNDDRAVGSAAVAEAGSRSGEADSV